ncbi:heat shock protein DnaJ, partial [Eremomyces bilateralis CBS 781.70]
MDLPLPFDAYAALGVSNTADSAEIKSAYRKLALITHPDKFPDEAIKKQKEDEFHRIRQAYEKVGDEDERKKYN